MYPTLIRNAGPTKARHCFQNPADGGGTGILLLNSSSDCGVGSAAGRGSIVRFKLATLISIPARAGLIATRKPFVL
jgi:hypothetical protein